MSNNKKIALRIVRQAINDIFDEDNKSIEQSAGTTLSTSDINDIYNRVMDICDELDDKLDEIMHRE